MNLNEYQDKAMSTCTESCDNISYMLINLVGEVGEFSSKLAKGIRRKEILIHDNEHLYHKDLDWTKFRKELRLEAGDILWQLAGLCSVMGWTLEEVAQINLEKLATRKENDTIIGEGDHR